MMDRRTLMSGTGAALLSAVGTLRAQTPSRTQRIAYLSLRPGPNEFEQAFDRGLRERGWIAGTNVVIDYRFAGFDLERENANVAALAASKPDLIVVADRLLGRLVQSLNAVPIVVPAFGDPVASGATTSLGRPDRNMTGTAVFNVELSAKRLELLKQAVPSLQQVAALYNADRPSKPLGVAATVEAGKVLGVTVNELGMLLPNGVEEGFVQAVRQGVQGVAIVSDTTTITYRERICDATLKHKLPTMFANRTYLRAGGLMSYGPDLESVFHRSAYFVDRILRGTKPADLPIEQVTTFQLVLNQRTARALGLRFPQALLLQATELIE